MLGVGTLVLPYSTMLYSHVPAAALAFGVSLRARASAGRLCTARPASLGGLAALVEYPVGLVALVLGLATPRGARCGAARSRGGRVAGLLPLAAYNLWAFGSVTHMSYEDVVGFEAPGRGAVRR